MERDSLGAPEGPREGRSDGVKEGACEVDGKSEGISEEEIVI